MKKILTILLVLSTLFVSAQWPPERSNPEWYPALRVSDSLIADSLVRAYLFETPGGNSDEWNEAASYTSNFVSITDFGANGNDTLDDTQAFLDARDRAAEIGANIYFPDGTFYIEEDTTISMNGVRGLVGKGTIDLSNFTTNYFDIPLLIWEGGINLVDSMISISEGENTANINTGLELNAGDIIFQVGPERLPSNNRRTIKSQRLTVEFYDSSSGDIRFFENFFYSTDSAWFFINDNPEYITFDGITILGGMNATIKGLSIINSFVYANNFEVSNFHASAFSIINSKAVLFDYRSYHPEWGSDTLSEITYGLNPSDLSNVEIYGADIKGGKHAIAAGGFGYWNDSFFGRTPSVIGTCPEVNIIGGSFASSTRSPSVLHLPPLDAHINVNSFRISDALIFGGVIVGGKRVVISNCEIYANTSFAIDIGRDATIIPFSDVTVRNCNIYNAATNSLVFNSRGYTKKLKIENLNIYGDWSNSSTNFVADFTSWPPEKIDIDGLSINAQEGDRAILMLPAVNNININNLFLKNCFLTLQSRRDSLSHRISNSEAHGAFLSGINFNSSHPDTNFSVTVTNLFSSNNGRNGLFIDNASVANVQNSFFADNGVNETSGQESGVLINNVSDIYIYNNNFNSKSQLNGVTANGTGSTDFSLVGNTFFGNTNPLQLSGIGDTISMLENRSDNEIMEDYLLNKNGDVETPLFADTLQSYVPVTGGNFTGNIGINTSSPSQALDITGNVNINASGGPTTSLINLNTTTGSGVFMNIQEQGVNRGRFDYSFGSNYMYIGVTNAGGTVITDALTVAGETNDNFVGINTNTPTERLHVVGNAQINGDVFADNIPTYLTGSATLDFPSTATNDYSELTITVTGAVVGDQVLPVVVPTGSITNNSSYEARVSNPDEVTIRFLNNGAVTAKDPASGTYEVRVLQF